MACNIPEELNHDMTVKRNAARKKKSTTHAPSDEMRQAWLLIQSLTCALITKLQAVLTAHDTEDEGWERLFGAKDSTVVNLQKLVGVLGEISDRLSQQPIEAHGAAVQTSPMDMQDMAMLKRWLEQELDQLKNND